MLHAVILSSASPIPRWKRSIGVILTLVVLGLAGYFRFDADAPWTGRTLVVGLWVAMGVGLYRLYRRVTPVVEQQMAQPNGYEEFVREATEHKRSEWAELQSRGEADYVFRTARWLGLLLLTTVGIARRWWRRAERSWPSESVAASPRP